MKKMLYILLLVIVSGVSLVSCTEENVTPATETSSGGGRGAEDGKV